MDVGYPYILAVFRKVFNNPRYLFLTLASAAAVFVFSALLPNWRLVGAIVESSAVGWAGKFAIIFSIVSSAKNVFGVFYFAYIILISILFGLNLALAIYCLKQQKSFFKRGAATSIFGVLIGALGVGCTVCGSLALNPLIILFGAGGAAVFLPLGGKEFAIAGVLLLMLSIFLTARRMNLSNNTCL